MQTDMIETSFLSVFAFLTFFIFLITNKFSEKFFSNILLDKDFIKPQAFHDEPISRCGGIASVISLILFFIIYYILYSTLVYEYIFVCLSLFLLGWLDDIKIQINPKTRLALMAVFLMVYILVFSIEIEHIDLIFLNFILENKIFSTIFVLLCFLFIINGANLVDGFNGLLVINLIIINSLLLAINLKNNQIEFSFLITAQIIILISFLLFNFPKAKMFLGDSGSYLYGSLVALNTIITNNLNPQISSFFFCILLFYLFFEVFFSFFRKIQQNKSPFHPDQEHLHMLVYKFFFKKFGAYKSNYLVSLTLNLTFFVFVGPSIIFADNGLICKYWFFSLIIIYSIIYIRLYRLTKN